MNAANRLPPSPVLRRGSGVQPATKELVAKVRGQAACVRTLLDEVERALPAELAEPMSVQLVEELGRLGCRCVELAAELSMLVDAQARVRCA